MTDSAMGCGKQGQGQRVLFAMIALSEGSEDKLLYFVQVAKTDYRNILNWAATGPLSSSEGAQRWQAALKLLEQWGKK